MDTKRLKFTVIIGTNELPKNKLNKIIVDFNRFYGGMTYSEKIGTWNETAVDSSDNYDDNYATETAHYFEIVTDNLNVSDNMHNIKMVCCHAANYANWVHVEMSEVQGLHFSIDEFVNEAIFTS